MVNVVDRQDSGEARHDVGNGFINLSRSEIGDRIRQSDDADEIKRLIVLREYLSGRTPAAIGDEFGWPVGTVETYLTDSGWNEPQSDGWTGRRFLVGGANIDWTRVIQQLAIVGLVFVLLLSFIQPSLVFGLRMDLLGHYGDLTDGRAMEPSDEELSIAVTDVAYLNRIFEERTTEVGYCGLIDGGVIRPWLAEFVNSTVSSVSVSVDNCPTGRYDAVALIHTHPNGDPRLSSEDRLSLDVPELAYLCVQHGPVTTAVGSATERLRCYETVDGEPGTDPVQRVPVTVVSDS